MEQKTKFLYLSEQEVKSLLTQEDAIRAAEEAFRSVGNGAITIGRMTLMTVDPAEKNNFHIMPAVMHERNIAGMKWIGTFGAPLPGYPFSHGNLIILSSTETGLPLAVVGATGITAMRTAGGHGVVQAKLLANPDQKRLSVFWMRRTGKKWYLRFPATVSGHSAGSHLQPKRGADSSCQRTVEVTC